MIKSKFVSLITVTDPDSNIKMLNYCANCNKELFNSATFCSKTCETEYESFIDDITFRRPRLSMSSKRTKISNEINQLVSKEVEKVLARHGV